MIRKTSKRRGTSVIAALIALCAVVGYGLTEWASLDNEPQAVPSRQREERQTVREKVEIPDKGEPVRLLTMNAGNYFVPEDPRRSNFQVKYKPVEAREAVAELVRQSGAEKKRSSFAVQSSCHAGRGGPWFGPSFQIPHRG